MSTVNVIPATKRSVKGGGQLKSQKDIRVAAYCRVSTGDESQQTSYTNQKAFYTGYINGKEGWKMAGIYADEAISGTSRAHRKEFNRMISDAESGKIDYIVTKSISRFARNTVDTLNCVRQLRQQDPPVGIYFEKENIDTLDATGELILTILSALAQDESRSISDNIRWTLQKNFQAGKPQINLNRMLGYDKGKNGKWVINPQQAEIVRFIFRKYVCGHSANSIARQANEAGMRTVNGKLWTSGAVLDILRNEKYVGDLEMQKTVTRDFLTHRSVKNNGEAPKYYVKDHHIGIIDRLTWDKVQAILCSGRIKKTKDGEKTKEGPKGSPFFNLTCGSIEDDGNNFFRMTYSGTAGSYRDERSEGFDPTVQLEKYIYAYPVWRCKRKYCQYRKKEEAENICTSTVIRECALEQSFMEMLYWLKRDYEANGEDSWVESEFRRACQGMSRRLGMNNHSVHRIKILEDQIRELEDILKTNPEKQIDRTGSIIRADDLSLRLENYRHERDDLEADQNTLVAMKKNYDFFIRCLRDLPEVNLAGMKMNINGQDVQGTMFRDINGKAKAGVRSAFNAGHIKITPERIAQAPDYLRFEKGIYAAFIQSGTVRGAEIEYHTNFGVSLRSYGNDRTLGSFLGYRRCRENGTVEFLDTLWKINDKKIQYRRTERKREMDESGR